MAVRCDVRRHVTLREKQGKLSAIVEEDFRQCANERAHIVITENGRVGVCKEHVEEYHEYRTKNEGKPTKERDPWTRLRRGVIIMGPEVVMKKPEGT